MPIETQSAEQNDHHRRSLQYIKSTDVARDDDRKRPNRIVAKRQRGRKKSEKAKVRNCKGILGIGSAKWAKAAEI